jgi:hypothetical protein
MIILYLTHHTILCEELSNKQLAINLNELAFNNMSLNKDKNMTRNSVENKTTIIDVCKLCWCSKKDTLDCRVHDKLDSLPIFALKSDRLQITEM